MGKWTRERILSRSCTTVPNAPYEAEKVGSDLNGLALGRARSGRTRRAGLTEDRHRSNRWATRDDMRVLILVQNLPVPFDRRVWQEARALQSAGYEVHIVCPRTKEYPLRRELLNGIQIYRYSPGPEARRVVGYALEYAIALFAQLRLALTIRLRHRIDIVHICNPPDLLFLVALPLVVVGARLIYDHHDANPEVMIAKGLPQHGLLVRATILFERLTYHFCHVSIETNNSFRAIALNRGKMSPEDVFIVRSAPQADRFAKAQPNEMWRRGRKHLVGYVGIMGRQDGLDNLIDAADLIIREWGRDDIQFVLVGDGPDFPRLQRRVASLGLAHQVEFTGLIASNEKLGGVLAAADVCVSPDEANCMNDISTMNKVIEYMALGKPIVQFDLTEGRFSAGEASLYAERNDTSSFAESIVQLIDDVELRIRMGEIGQQRLLAMLSWEQQIPQLLAAYERVLDRSRDPQIIQVDEALHGSRASDETGRALSFDKRDERT
jgi:glycosyltransferase involved in cell wall biosynthesis